MLHNVLQCVYMQMGVYPEAGVGSPSESVAEFIVRMASNSAGSWHPVPFRWALAARTRRAACASRTQHSGLS